RTLVSRTSASPSDGSRRTLQPLAVILPRSPCGVSLQAPFRSRTRSSHTAARIQVSSVVASLSVVRLATAPTASFP
ncbi:hypothetical protein BN1708_020306, partial [Verticillium longisporum]